MPAPYPGYASGSALPPSRTAREIIVHYGWIARYADMLIAAPDVDAAVMARLAFRHCRTFHSMTASPPTPLVIAVEKQFNLEGLEWGTRGAMATDLQAVRAAADDFRVFVRDSVPEVLTYAQNRVDENGNETVEPLTIPKTAAISAALTALRAVFT